MALRSVPDVLMRLQKSGCRLKESEETKHIFIAPDRSIEECEERKKLVYFIKEKRKGDPEW